MPRPRRAPRLARRSYLVTYELPIVILRPFNNYGPFSTGEGVPRFIIQALNDEPLTIHGDGHARVTGSSSRTTPSAIEAVDRGRHRARRG